MLIPIVAIAVVILMFVIDSLMQPPADDKHIIEDINNKKEV